MLNPVQESRRSFSTDTSSIMPQDLVLGEVCYQLLDHLSPSVLVRERANSLQERGCLYHSGEKLSQWLNAIKTKVPLRSPLTSKIEEFSCPENQNDFISLRTFIKGLSFEEGECLKAAINLQEEKSPFDLMVRVAMLGEELFSPQGEVDRRPDEEQFEEMNQSDPIPCIEEDLVRFGSDLVQKEEWFLVETLSEKDSISSSFLLGEGEAFLGKGDLFSVYDCLKRLKGQVVFERMKFLIQRSIQKSVDSGLLILAQDLWLLMASLSLHTKAALSVVTEKGQESSLMLIESKLKEDEKQAFYEMVFSLTEKKEQVFFFFNRGSLERLAEGFRKLGMIEGENFFRKQVEEGYRD